MLGSLWFNSFSAGGGGAAADYELIATSYGTGSSGSVTFSSIPSTYKQLQIRYAGVLTYDYDSGIVLRMNGVTSSIYSTHGLYGQGSSVVSYAYPNSTYVQIMGEAAGMTTLPAAGIIDILDYTSTSKNKTVKAIAGVARSANGLKEIGLYSGALYSTSAVTSITLVPSAGFYATTARFSLYGLR